MLGKGSDASLLLEPAVESDIEIGVSPASGDEALDSRYRAQLTYGANSPSQCIIKDATSSLTLRGQHERLTTTMPPFSDWKWASVVAFRRKVYLVTC